MDALTRIPEATRAWLYRVATAVVLLAGLYGIIDDEVAAGWAALVAALLSGTLATANTSTKPAVEAPPEYPPGFP